LFRSGWGEEEGVTRRASSFELILPPRPEGVPSFHWLRNALRAEILNGRIAPGSKLPASREFARQYQLSRGTILAALDELQAEGYLEGRRGSGTYISRILPEHLLPSQEISEQEASGAAPKGPHLSAFAARVRPFSLYVKPESRAFRTNLPALDLFPTTLWAQVSARRLRSASARNLLGCEAQGYLPLRQAVAHYAHTSRGVNCSAEQIVIVSGVQEGLDLATRLLLNPGDKVLVEDPGYQGAYTLFHAAGARIVAAPLDAEGAAPKEADFRSCRLVYVTPGHQYPVGMTMSLQRRLQLLAWAKKYDTPIFEDDYDSEFRFSGRPLPAMQGLDRGGKVIFCGSFNKVMFPSLRLGYLVLPRNLVDVFTCTKAMTTRHHSLLDQAALCDFIDQGHLGRHLRRMRRIYEERFNLLLECAQQHLAEYLEVSNIEAGLQTIGRLRIGVSAELVAQRAAMEEIDVVPLSRYCHTVSIPEGLQIGFADVQEKEIRAGVLKLARVFEPLKAAQLMPKPLKGAPLKSEPSKPQTLQSAGAIARR
jgi:GntR family transcriptional regulator/MocR family aminotransferase